jgi:hypothetical protein
MTRRGNRTARLNIYVPDPSVRRGVKMAAAKRDLSVSEYCLRAITSQLMTDGERPGEERSRLVRGAVERARRFQTERFRGRVFSVSSADLIRNAREQPDAR